MPAEKKPPAPVRTAARRSSEASSSSTASAIPRATAASSALRACGRLMVMIWTAPRRSTSTSSATSPPRDDRTRGPGRAPGPPRTSSRSGLGAAGGVDHLAGDEARTLADEERHQVRDVLGLADALHRDLLRGERDEVVERHAHALRGRLGHLRLDEPRGDRVGRDAELAQLDGESLGEALQTGLR